MVVDKINLLYIEDEAALARMVDNFLRNIPSLPNRLHWVGTLAEGLAHLEQHAVDVVLLDLNLPDSLGIDTLTRMRAAAPHLAIVVVTGQGDEEMVERMLGLGAQEYLPKDELRPNILERAIRFARQRKLAETRMLQERSDLEMRVKERTRELMVANHSLMAEIDERRRMEDALRKSEEQSRILLESMPLAIGVYDMQGKMVFINATFQNTFGWRREELLGHRPDFVPPEHEAELIPRVEMMKKGQTVEPFESVRLTKDGRRLNVVISTAPLLDSYGVLLGNIVVFRDITRYKQAELAMAESERRYQTLIETMSEGLVEVDENSLLTFINESFARMLGYSKEELLHRSSQDLVTEASRQAMLKEWERRKEGHGGSYEVAWLKKDGGLAFTLISGKPRFDSQGHFTGSLALITNITEHKILEGQLLHSQKMEAIGQLAAGIAHEINTPTQYVSDNSRFLLGSLEDLLKAIARYRHLAELVESSQPVAPSLAQALEELKQTLLEVDSEYLLEEMPKALSQNLEGLQRISTIVRSMKEFAHPGVENKTSNDLNRAIENTVIVAKNEWKYVAEVVTDLDKSLPPVPCVLGQINQVLLNIIVNAAHAIGDVVKETDGPKGRIAITTRLAGNNAEIRIADNGSGIPDAIRQRIFDPFFTTKPPGKGTGQGLAIAYRVVVDKHGGTLKVESAEGQGTTFVITLPLIDSGAGAGNGTQAA